MRASDDVVWCLARREPATHLKRDCSKRNATAKTGVPPPPSAFPFDFYLGDFACLLVGARRGVVWESVIGRARARGRASVARVSMCTAVVCTGLFAVVVHNVT